jgi:Tfp pilus assembly protein PilX
MHKIMKKYFIRLEKKQKGFALLFAVLVSTLVVSIGASIISVALRQTILSGTSRESQYAFYAANTVMECAFYWDITGVTGSAGSVFPAEGESALTPTEQADVNCAGGNLATGSGFSSPRVWDLSSSSGETVTTFYIELKDSASPIAASSVARCAQATVTKTTDSVGAVTTRIDAKGYNTCDLNSARVVERGLVQEYKS